MVKLEEVVDETFKTEQAGEDEWDTSDAESVVSDASSLADDGLEGEDETLLERLSALKDIVPPATRRSLAHTWAQTTEVVGTGARWSGKALWVLGTSVLLVGVPWALAFTEEQQLEMMEREMKAQESAGQMMTQGVDGGARPAL